MLICAVSSFVRFVFGRQYISFLVTLKSICCWSDIVCDVYYDFLHSLFIHSMSSKNYQNEQITPVRWYCTAKNISTDRKSDTIYVTTRHYCVYYADLHLQQACSTFWVVRTTSAKFDLHGGNMKFNVQNEEWISVHKIICVNLLTYFSVIICNTNIWIILEKNI